MTGGYKVSKHTGMKIKTDSDNKEKSLHFVCAVTCLMCPLFSPSKFTAYLEK